MMKKAPDRSPRLCLCLFCERLEAIVDAATHDVRMEVYVGRQCAASARTVRVAEIDIEIFDLGGPRTGDGRFDAAAHRPARIGVGRAAEARYRRLDVADGETTGDVG